MVVIDFWASWCVACRAEQPDLNALANAYEGRGVRFLGDDMRDSLAPAQSYVREFHVRYPSVVDASSDIAAAFGVGAPPTVIVVDQRGRIVGRYLGTVTGVAQQLDALTHRA
ncbi:MAG: TlpA disulfide reductase family protein [Candidatus Dormibacter sp.]